MANDYMGLFRQSDKLIYQEIKDVLNMPEQEFKSLPVKKKRMDNFISSIANNYLSSLQNQNT